MICFAYLLRAYARDVAGTVCYCQVGWQRSEPSGVSRIRLRFGNQSGQLVLLGTFDDWDLGFELNLADCSSTKGLSFSIAFDLCATV